MQDAQLTSFRESSCQNVPKLKICFVGWGNSIHLQRWMQWFINNNHDVHLITNHPSNMAGITEYDISLGNSFSGSRLRRYLSLDFNVYYLRSLRRIMKIDIIKQIFKIRKTIHNIKPDILHLHTFLYPAYLGVFSNTYPLVATPWNGDILWKTQWSLIRKYAVRSGLARADLITVDSDELREKTLQYGKYEKKIEYISFGVDTRLFNPEASSPDLRKWLKIAQAAPVVFSNRGFEDIYNIDIIIRSIPSVLKACPATVFLFSWHSASKKDYIKKLTESLGITDSVRFLGKIEHRKLPKYYAESDIFVSIPSGDTIPISLLEAMACGTAPVVSDLLSVKECIKDGINGYIIPVRDVDATAQAIIRLLKDNSLRRSFSERNLEWVVRNADWNQNMRRVEKLYCSLAQLRHRRLA